MTADYWDSRYASVGSGRVSWFQADPAVSLELISRAAPAPASVVDVGGGASLLTDRLLAEGYHDVTVVDISGAALRETHDRIGESPVHFVESDVRDWQPDRTFDVWHDRAAYHFLVDAGDRARYWDLVRESVPEGGHIVMATFAEDGPQTCSGLPVQRHSVADLVREMGEGFALVEDRREEHTTPAGGTQSFVWILARRT